MTSDLRARNRCPHQVKGEWLSLDVSDTRTLRPLRPVSSAGEVKVRINGEEAPREGLKVGALFTTPTSGPWRVVKGVNDRLALGLDSSEDTHILEAPPSPSWRASNLASEFNTQFSKMGLSSQAFWQAESDGRMSLVSLSRGPASGLALRGLDPRVAPRNLAPTLGLPSRRQYRGRTTLPGWDLVQDPLVRAAVDPTRKVVLFRDRLDRFLPEGAVRTVFEMSYATLVGACRRCAALSNEWDHRYDSQGEPVVARDVELLLQEAEKIVITVLGSNVFHPWYGTNLETLIGRKVTVNTSFLESQVQQGVTAALNRLQSLKAQQARLQPVTDLEYLARVVSVDVSQDPADPVFLKVSITLQNRAGDVQTLTRSVAALNAVRPDLLAPRRLS
jgi:phage baseplate assembly protein W